MLQSVDRLRRQAAIVRVSVVAEGVILVRIVQRGALAHLAATLLIERALLTGHAGAGGVAGTLVLDLGAARRDENDREAQER
jgi:hypothetical protein